MCHSGVTSCAVTNTRCHCAGTSSQWMWPDSAIRCTRASEYHPSRFAIATKSSFTSGMSTPAWFRMNATANSGSMPEEHPAMIEIVPVGATVVRLQLRSRRIGRMRSPRGPRAARVRSRDRPLPLGEDAALLRQLLRRRLRLLVHELHHLATERHALVRVVANPQPHEQIGPTHHAQADAADALGQLVDLRQRILVGIDHVVE